MLPIATPWRNWCLAIDLLLDLKTKTIDIWETNEGTKDVTTKCIQNMYTEKDTNHNQSRG